MRKRPTSAFERLAQALLAAAILACVSLTATRDRAAVTSPPSAVVAARVVTGGKGRTPLMNAILSGKQAQALALIARSDVDARDDHGWSALIDASFQGDAVVIAALLRHGADRNARTRDGGKGALEYAVQCGHADAMWKLIGSGVDANAADDAGATPLMWAALRSDAGMTRALLAARANPNLQDARGYTALAIATMNNDAAVARLLLTHGADPSIGAGQEKKTPLELAIDEQAVSVARMLVWCGAPVNTHGPDGFTPLMLAIQNNRLDLTRILIARRADVNARTDGGMTALCFACAQPAGNEEIVRALLSGGAKIDLGADDGTTPLMYASQAGHEGIVRLLLARGASPDVITNRGMTALHYADGEGYAATVGKLLRGRGEQR